MIPCSRDIVDLGPDGDAKEAHFTRTERIIGKLIADHADSTLRQACQRLLQYGDRFPMSIEEGHLGSRSRYPRTTVIGHSAIQVKGLAPNGLAHLHAAQMQTLRIGLPCSSRFTSMRIASFSRQKT